MTQRDRIEVGAVHHPINDQLRVNRPHADAVQGDTLEDKPGSITEDRDDISERDSPFRGCDSGISCCSDEEVRHTSIGLVVMLGVGLDSGSPDV
jgi:hypothetical protein